ncbi:MAG: hypothetical protein HZC13_07310 [Nitrospirae bacterium]|nr:hypothetical protein [Nitrospirota bacterium]MBI5096276.1 hypothetical protein [Nitrospirota bacterium]
MSRVKKTHRPAKHSANGRTKPSHMGDLIELFRHLEKVKQQARVLGIFTDDRELLACPSCGLLEDVTAEGLLVTYPKDIKDPKDTGLRFHQLDTESFQCPACGATCHLPTEEELWADI